MRRDPLYFIWRVDCPTPADSLRLQQQLPPVVAPNATFVDEVRSSPGGVGLVWREPHRVGDYFESVRVLPPANPQAVSFRLLFQRRPEAGRYWKDLMVRVLRWVRAEAAEATTTLEYRGDEIPVITEAPV